MDGVDRGTGPENKKIKENCEHMFQKPSLSFWKTHSFPFAFTYSWTFFKSLKNYFFTKRLNFFRQFFYFVLIASIRFLISTGFSSTTVVVDETKDFIFKKSQGALPIN